MALDPLGVTFELDTLVCHDEGKDPGKETEPYLWTVFFKVDGSTAALNSLTLSGAAATMPTPGSHGNLGDTSVNTGDTVPVPDAIGRWSTTLTAIPVAPELQPFAGTDRISGAAGVVIILMEHDWTSDRVANAGHAALNASLQTELNRIVGTLGAGNENVDQGDIDAIAKKVGAAVTEAIKANGRIFQDIANLINADDTLGADAVIFTHAELEANGTRDFSRRFRPEKRGDWEIRGRVTAVRRPPLPLPRPAPVRPRVRRQFSRT